MCLKEGLQQFCKCSGQKVNYDKSSMIFSLNVPEEEAGRLSNMLSISLTRQWGKYLGH